jgi:hypothetical protein
MLGIGHVPPAKPGHFTMAELIASASPEVRDYTQQRLLDEAIAHGGVVRGELSWWIPEIADARIGMYRIDEAEGIAEWTAYLQAGAIVPPQVQSLVEQIAAAIMFDVLIDNADRWTGNNTKCSVDRRTLYFMDNTLSFSTLTVGHAANLSKLYKIQVFPRVLVARLRALTAERVEAALGADDELLGPLLTRAEIRAIIARRDHFLEYIDRLIAELGEDAVLALP